MQQIKKYIPLAIVMFLLYLATLYWNSFVELIGTLITASSALIIGFVLAYIVNILMVEYEKIYHKLLKGKYEKVKRPLTIVISYLTVFIVFGVIASIIIPQLINAITVVVKDGGNSLTPYLKEIGKIPVLETYASEFEKYISSNSSITSQVSTISQYIFSGVSNVFSAVTQAVSSVISTITTLLFSFMFSLYLLGGKETLIGQTKRVLKVYCSKYYDSIIYVIKIFNSSYRNFIIGQVTEAVIIGVLCALGCTLLKIPYGTMVGTIIGVTALIPIVGAYIGAAISAFLIFTVNPMSALEFLVFIVILQQLEDNLIYPRVVGSSLGLPGLWVLASITILGGVFGFVGMLVGVPFVSAIYRLVQNDLRKRLKEE